MVEGATEAFRAHLPELKEWTHFPEEGSPGSVGLLDGIKTYAAHVDSTDAGCNLGCGAVGALGVDSSNRGLGADRLGLVVDRLGDLGDWGMVDPLVS